MEPNGYHHEVDLLLSCACVIVEEIEAAIFTPLAGEIRHCRKHKTQATIKRVGYPYRVEHPKEEVAQPAKGQ